MTLRSFPSRFAVRYVATMPVAIQPRLPLVAIMGTTGTGKSDLAVDLAVRFNGEVINADAMQMYRGLPVITNQISAEEQRGVPHHLLATIRHDQPTWTVGVFAREAAKLISEIRGRGKLPIIVGGTHYYISALIFENSLVDSQKSDNPDVAHITQTDTRQQHAILEGPTDLMLQRLREVDPVIASRWHPDDRRKIQRSLEIFLTTGRKASDIYAEQQEAIAAIAPSSSPWEALMFWVYSKPDILRERLDKRIDKMEKAGLMDEVKELHQYLRDQSAIGNDVDRTRGIWQSIGFKQFEPFLDGERDGVPSDELGKLRATGLEDMKTATRQYARSQLRWIRLKTAPALKERDALRYFYLLDSSDASNFSQNVLSPASEIAKLFLDGQELPLPAGVSETAAEILSAFDDENMKPKPVFEARRCDLCNVTLTSEDQWNKHLKGRSHRRVLKHKSRTALVPVQDGNIVASEPSENSPVDPRESIPS
ncbi:tRNA dimethylallyltransferase [Apiospora saccharicola]|uniref:tRNA dimethylallyltransferase n=1 Tax=Apiospora saccharicola TaxID=335842 RepID=A0ABR1TM78_9PEZI